MITAAFVFLIVGVILIVSGFLLHLNNMRKMINKPFDDEMPNGLFNGIVLFAFGGFSIFVSIVLFIISLVMFLMNSMGV